MADDRKVVAAVAYREGPAGPEFLLVHTKGGNKWTFPKGGVEKREDGPAAASREAKEEAGVIDGDIDDAPFTRYEFPKTRGRTDLVDAYLFRVTELGLDREHRRWPTWYTPQAARDALADGGREPRYAEEHARVLVEALAELKKRGQRD